MEIYFKDKKMQKACNSEKECSRAWGDKVAKKVQQRLAELKAADVLADISHLPPPRLHKLVGDKEGLYAVDLVHPYRLIFEPADDPLPLKDDGGVDLQKVTKVLVIKVIDYH